jgi:hypothetical protein
MTPGSAAARDDGARTRRAARRRGRSRWGARDESSIGKTGRALA